MLLPLNDFKANYVRMCVHCFWEIFRGCLTLAPFESWCKRFCVGQCKALSLPLKYSLVLATPQILLKAVPQLDGFKRCSYGRDFGVDGDSGIC